MYGTTFGRGRSGSLKLRGKIILSVLTVVSLIFIAVISYVAVMSSGKATQDAQALAFASAREIASQVESTLRKNINILNTIASIAQHMDRTQPNAREVLMNMLEASVLIAPDTVSMWFAFEPDVFDKRDKDFAGTPEYGKTGQFIGCYFDNGGKAERTNDVSSETIYAPGSGDYYTVPLKTGKSVVMPPEFFTFETGKKTLVSSISVPIQLDGKVAGVVGIDFDYEYVQNAIASTQAISPNSIFSLADSSGIIIFSKDSQNIGKNLADILDKNSPATPQILQSLKEGKGFHDFAISALNKKKSLRIYSPVGTGIPGESLSIIATVPEDDILTETRAMTRNSIIATVVGLMLLGITVFFVGTKVVRPIVAISDMLKRTATLNFTTVRANDWILNYKDEVGDMGRNYAAFKSSMVEMLKVLDSQMRSFASTAQNLAAISEESVASMEEVKASVDEVTRLSNDNSTALDHTNAGVEEVSHASNATARSSEEGAAIAGRTSELTRQAFSEVDEVVGSIRQAGERSRDSGHSILKVNESVGAIASFVSTITGIADQTNLLALNAAIEAARAGEAGRGFAVVAEEVRKLAEESGRAAQEVQKLISVLQSDSSKANSVIEAMGKLLVETIDKAGSAQAALKKSLSEVDELSGHMQTIAAAAEEQAASSSEMANSVNRVTTATADIGKALQNIQSATAETASASESVATEAQNMTEGVMKLEELVSRFQYDGKHQDEHTHQALPPKKNKK